MLPRDRVKLAMEMRHPDRVPSMSQFSVGFMNQQLKDTGITPMELWLDAERYAEALIILRERFDFDGILVSIHGHYQNWREKVLKVETLEGRERATFSDRVETYLDDDLPMGEFFEPREQSIDDVDVSKIPTTIDYIPASKGCYIFIDSRDPFRIFDILNSKVGGEYSIHGEITSPLDYLLDLLGYESGLLAMVTHPEKVWNILEQFTLGVEKLGGEMAAHSAVDAIKISSPFAGIGFISPEFYRQFELPYLSRVVHAIQSQGIPAYVHTCGHINDRLEIIAESGVKGLECLDPPPIGNVELDDAFQRVGGQMFIKGNVDSVNTLLNGDERLIRQDLKHRLNIGMQNRGFILSTACSIAPGVPAEHVMLLSKLAREFGQY